MNVGEKLTKARRNSGLSQEEVAEKIKVTRQTISKWELNETLPNIEQAQLLAQLYNKNIDELINKDEYKEITETIKQTTFKNADKINWTKVWSKKYPVLSQYQSEVDINFYTHEIQKLLKKLANDYNYNDLDAMLVFKDILAHNWQSKK